MKKDLSRKLRGIASSVNGALVSLESQAETRGKLERACCERESCETPQARSVPAASTQPGGSSTEPCWYDGKADEAEVRVKIPDSAATVRESVLLKPLIATGRQRTEKDQVPPSSNCGMV